MLSFVVKPLNAISNSPQCIHCGNVIPQGRLTRGSSATPRSAATGETCELIFPSADQFCCAGCEAVYTLLQNRGLGEYYRLKSQAGTLRPTAPADAPSQRASFLPDPAFLSDYTSEEGCALHFYLEGVQCAACVWLVEKLPEFAPEVKEARLDLSRSTVTVRLHQAGSFANAAHELGLMGYRPHPVQRDQSETLQKLEDHRLLVRVGIAGACAGNIMILAVALYGGAQGTLGRAFEWASFALCLPVLFYSAIPFYRSAWGALRKGEASIDLPISIGMISGGAISALHLFQGNGEIYFDTVSSLVFLLLATRYLLRRVQNQAQASSRLIHFLAPSIARRISPAGEITEVRIQELQAGDHIEVPAGEVFPVDGKVLQGRSQISSALLSGESKPHLATEGSLVFAGTQNLSSPLRIEVQASGVATRLSQILESLRTSLLSKPPIVQTLDKVGRAFVWAVLLLTVVAFLVGWATSPHEALKRAMAMAIIVCPCTFALATPLAFSLALQRAASAGVLIKSAEAIERLSRIRTLFFDKTGTLTSGNLEVLSWEPLTKSATEILFALERPSKHPIARAIQREFQSLLNIDQIPSLENYREIPGVGIQATIEGAVYRIERLEPSQDAAFSGLQSFPPQSLQTLVGLSRNGQLIGKLVLGDRLRPDSMTEIEKLRTQGYEVRLISGDQAEAVTTTAQKLGLESTQTIALATPEMKGQILRKTPQSLMVGDGANDVIALAAASVGIAVQGGMEASFHAADGYSSLPGISGVFTTLQIARQTMQVIRWNLIFAVFYNLIGIAFALSGSLSPLVAALLMPASALTVFLCTVIGMRASRFKQKTQAPSALPLTSNLESRLA